MIARPPPCKHDPPPPGRCDFLRPVAVGCRAAGVAMALLRAVANFVFR
ncbi:MAG: hypothetical protein ONB48_16260 [candidate division KSB1 bacterium]|nr:hypothetical protein [candidate division KSB1 bacterium]MDZ7274275.1 hypothetical protein [candidate division KSB1 bacterium]MDZ7287203.1 hypothetical protein [candidate division KSB1 bacterium]MDZ7296872.1 hypothetical protein [candidate division KSB1 bacterium]MDZ7306023.1 hypothetical protein [candidate division KSB1 bacterium]